jgi:hypothetical protein
MGSFKRRGQAFVIFGTLEAAKTALTSMQSFPFCGKPMVGLFVQAVPPPPFFPVVSASLSMLFSPAESELGAFVQRINFARTKSDSVAKADGSFQAREKRLLGPLPVPKGKK